MLTFKEQVVLALLNNVEDYLVPFQSPGEAAEYVAANAPETMADHVMIQQKVIAVQVAEQANEIVRTVG